MSLLLFSIAAALLLYVFIYYTLFRGAKCTSQTQLRGKTAIVTGANTGIGKATALGLAKRGARVILACRSKERAEAAVLDIRRESGNNQVLFMPLDLSRLQSVRDFVETFLKTEPRLDFLINNAGVVSPGRTHEGFGMEFGVNHLGHFLLTLLLLDRLKQCAPSRIVTVASRAHLMGDIDFALLDSTKDLVRGERNLTTDLKAYSHSKLCNVLFTRELANQLEGSNVSCFSLHPGVIKTEIGRNLSRWFEILITPIAALFFLDAEGGAQTTLHCVLQEGLEPLSGRYFSDCAVAQVSAKARDDALAKKLWEVSERLSGVTAPPTE
ncbi:dehydrogenase/reductase SDR family member 13-like [Eucyclogobius newberryi]|uniref:dehydrogenase/reductase SDR family member 13-like n=1 Tax=Eucyclogobius newberryi TaxID=166745 RepID=UPI003B594524